MPNPCDPQYMLELINRVCAGDEEALVRLIRCWGCPDDILSKVFLKLRHAPIWRNLPAVDIHKLAIVKKYIRKTIKSCQIEQQRQEIKISGKHKVYVYDIENIGETEEHEDIFASNFSTFNIVFNEVKCRQYRDRLMKALRQLAERNHLLSVKIILDIVIGDKTIEDMFPELQRYKPELTRDNAYQIKSRNIKKLRQIDPELADYDSNL